MDTAFPRILHAGESCIVVEFGSAIDLDVNARVQALRKRIEGAPFPGFVETVPTYRSLAVCFDPLCAPEPETLEKRLREMAEAPSGAGALGGGRLLVPVCYDDLEAALRQEPWTPLRWKGERKGERMERLEAWIEDPEGPYERQDALRLNQMRFYDFRRCRRLEISTDSLQR